MNVRDGGIMRTNYAIGSDDEPLKPDPTKPINPFGPKPTGPVLPDRKASVDDPFYRSGDEDEHSFRMFNKPYKELNADELEEFREEMMRLMNKFSSAPDPMDERNSMLENLSRQYFNKPLRNLSPKEIELLGTMSDKKVSKIIGISRLNVYKKRHELNINTYKNKQSGEPT